MSRLIGIYRVNKDGIDDLAEALMFACDASSYPAINRGRATILAMAREDVIESIEHVAKQQLDLDDEWHFRRFGELCGMLDHSLLLRVCERGRSSRNPAVREAAEDLAASD